MTDRDVVERVANRFGTSVMAIDKGKYRTEFAATVKGERAVSLKRDIEAMMGERRQAAITQAIGCFRPPDRKLSFDAAEEIRRRYARGESVSSIARFFRVARQTIHQVLQRSIYRDPPSRPWRDLAAQLPASEPPAWMSVRELYWLAGWLEGEGSFLAPPPSDPIHARISGQARDKDVMAEVGRLLCVKPLLDRSGQARNSKWSPMWRVLLKGSRATSLMLALQPLVGERRRHQIRSAVTAAFSHPPTESAPKTCMPN
jgi:hypothetical protein